MGAAGPWPEPARDGEVARRATAGAFTELVASGWDLPLPGSGATLERWRGLAALGERDLPLARLAEGHADALAVLAELGCPRPGPRARLGVWAAEPPDARLHARRDGARWRLGGRKAWCSGARVLTDALVTAHGDDGPRLFLVHLAARGVSVDPSVWVTAGMAAADTADVHFDGVPALALGHPGDYTGRPGFWHGGIGVAAVWAGGARPVAARLRAAVDRGPFVAAAAGAADVGSFAVEAALHAAAAEVDRDPGDLGAARRRALRVRALAARAVEEVLRSAGRALGAAPLAHERAHAQRVADLGVYVRQHHGDRDLAELGRLLGGGDGEGAGSGR